MKTIAIARLTLVEAAKRRLLLAGAVMGLAFVALFFAAFWFLDGRGQDPDGALSAVASTVLTVFGLYAVYFLTGVMAVFLAAGTISNDIETGVLHALLARPISRAQYVAGRWVGLSVLMAAYVAVMAGALLGTGWLFADYVALDAAAAIALLVLQTTVLVSLALLGSTVLPTVANALGVLALYALAWMAGIIANLGRSLDNDAMVLAGTIVTVVVPSDALWRGAAYFAQSPLLLSAGQVPGVPFASSTSPPAAWIAWGVLYPLVVLGLAALVFSRRDL